MCLLEFHFTQVVVGSKLASWPRGCLMAPCKCELKLKVLGCLKYLIRPSDMKVARASVYSCSGTDFLLYVIDA
jgi:hypothetical protein